MQKANQFVILEKRKTVDAERAQWNTEKYFLEQHVTSLSTMVSEQADRIGRALPGTAPTVRLARRPDLFAWSSSSVSQALNATRTASELVSAPLSIQNSHRSATSAGLDQSLLDALILDQSKSSSAPPDYDSTRKRSSSSQPQPPPRDDADTVDIVTITANSNTALAKARHLLAHSPF